LPTAAKRSPGANNVAPKNPSHFVTLVIRSPRTLLVIVASIGAAVMAGTYWHRVQRRQPTAREQVVATPPARPAMPATTTPAQAPATREQRVTELAQQLAEPGQPLTVERLLGGARVDRAQLQDLVRLAASELPAGDRSRVLQAIGEWVGAHAPAWAPELIAALADFHDRFALTKAAVETLANEDPRRAADWAAQLQEPALRQGAMNVLAMQWAAKDVAAAAEWAGELPAGAERASAFEGVAWAWAQRDQNAAYQWAMSIEDPALRDQVLVKMAKMIAIQDGKSAVDWAQHFPAGTARDDALHYAVFQWATHDLAAAADWAGQIADAKVRTETELAIARSWAVDEPQGATAWAAAISDPPTRALALQATIQKWAEKDVPAAAHWIDAQSAAPQTVEVFRNVAANLAAAQPELAQRWVNAVADPSWRSAGQAVIAAAKPAPPRR
jgi:hypothetical protein